MLGRFWFASLANDVGRFVGVRERAQQGAAESLFLRLEPGGHARTCARLRERRLVPAHEKNVRALAGELFGQANSLKLLHVPFKGGAQTAVALAGGEIEMAFATIPSVMPFLHSKRIRLLAITLATVFTGRKKVMDSFVEPA